MTGPVIPGYNGLGVHRLVRGMLALERITLRKAIVKHLHPYARIKCIYVPMRGFLLLVDWCETERSALLATFSSEVVSRRIKKLVSLYDFYVILLNITK